MIKLTKKLFLLILLSSLFVPLRISASPNYYCSAIDYRKYKTAAEIEEPEQKEKIETFLQRSVPGLSVSFREVIDALIAEGHHVYLTGGVVRDLLSLSSGEPHDVDLDYSGTVEELIAILDRKQWRYTRLPGQSLVIIGDHRLGSIDAMPIREDKGVNESTLEFTINNIFYNCNSRAFTQDSEPGLKDLQNDRIHIAAGSWKNWLYQPWGNRYYKVFRFWKMVGKGYVYSTELVNFFRMETERILREDKEEFDREMLGYISKHMYSYNELNRGCIAVMGYGWTSVHLAVLKEEAAKRQEEFNAKKDRYTYHFLSSN